MQQMMQSGQPIVPGVVRSSTLLGEADRARRIPALVSDCDCRILNAVFGAIVAVDASAYPDMPGNAVVPCGTTDEAVSSTSAGAFCCPLCLLTVDWAFDACDMLNLH